ncbi:MAG: tRNA lysidine(34) synthetase TilS [Lachnospiraceae bacterium]|nr:tRNA lysidine(34) synthetase TilS [Lachnospiraceae bacterium]
MIQRVLKYVKEQHMLDEGDCVVAGVSGGADSVCLLLMLLEIRKVIPIDIRVVHVNHLIREDAAEDAAYVRSLCLAHDLAFTLVEEDVEKLARNLRISAEEAGRNVRYNAFFGELGSRKGRIAIAHNKNDCCETFLFHLFRGASLKGLTGIRPVRDQIIRPLMCLERSEIEAFLQERKVRYCIDSTNLEDNYTRNKIRHHILDTAVREISPAAVNHISDACKRVSEAYDLIEDITRQGCETCVSITGENQAARYHIDKDAFLQLHRTIQGYVVMEVLSRAAGSRKDLEAVHVRQVLELMERQCGKEVRLPYHLCARRDYTGILIESCAGCGTKKENLQMAGGMEQQEIVLTKAEREKLMAGECITISLNEHQCLRADILSKKDITLQNIPQKKYTKWFDYDKIKDNIVIRTRRQGDYLTVNSMNQRKTLKAYFIDHKIPQEQRGSIWLAAEGSHVLWIIGERISSYYKVSEATEHILRFSFMELPDEK